MSSTSLTVSHGMLLTTDPPTVVYLMELDAVAGPRKFVIKQLDESTLFVKNDPEVRKFIQLKLADRLAKTKFEEDEAADMPMTAHP